MPKLMCGSESSSTIAAISKPIDIITKHDKRSIRISISFGSLHFMTIPDKEVKSL
jgi:hypothetical protein